MGKKSWDAFTKQQIKLRRKNIQLKFQNPNSGSLYEATSPENK